MSGMAGKAGLEEWFQGNAYPGHKDFSRLLQDSSPVPQDSLAGHSLGCDGWFHAL